MKMNERMSLLLKEEAVSWPLIGQTRNRELPKLEFLHDCTLLKSESERNKAAEIRDFPDKTGFECFINHVHFPFAGTRESLVACLQYAAAVEGALAFGRATAQDARQHPGKYVAAGLGVASGGSSLAGAALPAAVLRVGADVAALWEAVTHWH